MAVIASDTLDALAGARHSDPFAVLGPHVDGETLVIRTIQPSAARVDVVRPGVGVTEMSRVHAAGVFEATFPNTSVAFDYRLRITYPSGHTAEIDDPYRYGRVITDYDVHLFSQGKHTR